MEITRSFGEISGGGKLLGPFYHFLGSLGSDQNDYNVSA